MLFLVALALVVVGALCLVIGFVTEAAAVIYLSLACSLVAFVMLIVYARVAKRQEAAGSAVQETSAPAWPPAAAPVRAEPEPTTGEAEPTRVETAVAKPWVAAEDAEPTTATAAAASPEDADEADELPIAGYDRMRVAQILPLLPTLDLDELAAVREHEEEGRNRGTIIRRVDQLMDELEKELDEGAEEAEEPAPSGWSAAAADRTTILPTVTPETAAEEAAPAPRLTL